MITRKLHELAPGNQFFYGGIWWVKLSDDPDNAESKCITSDIECHMAFDSAGNSDWRYCSLRERLNDTSALFMLNILENGGIRDDFVWTLTGTKNRLPKDIELAADLFALITNDEYKKYTSILPPVDGLWWSNSQTLGDVSAIDSYGNICGCSPCNSDVGIRPCCTLKHETWVNTHGGDVEEYDGDNIPAPGRPASGDLMRAAAEDIINTILPFSPQDAAEILIPILHDLGYKVVKAENPVEEDSKRESASINIAGPFFDLMKLVSISEMLKIAVDDIEQLVSKLESTVT